MLTTLLINMLLFGSLVFSIVTIVFLIAQQREDNSVMDIAYGPTFALAAIGTLLIVDTPHPLAILIAALITIWATRLGLRIWRKNHGKPEDARYAAWRTTWMTRGTTYFLIRSYFQINLLQGLIILIVALPFIVAQSAGPALGSIYTIAGTLLMFFGLLYESIADWQLDRFLAGKRAGTEPALLMERGLFRYSRRPNYFGEALIWWGLAVIAWPLPFGYVALAGPLMITYIVTKVTGPMLERIFLEKYPDAYRDYMARTSYFIPWRPRR
jgi:steroid 5-alpha reductase family enzyme